MGNVHAGTSGWAYPKWRSGFYPKELPAAKFLDYYATRVNSVEVNYTFLRAVTKELLREWTQATPGDFVFAVKAPQQITHLKRLRDAGGLAREFVKSLLPLRRAGKLGPILFQLPPNMKREAGRLREFLKSLPKKRRYAFEFRHESWFVEEVYEALRQSGAALCFAESERIVTPEIRTADFSYLRLRKANYSAKEVARRVRELRRRGDVFVYFKHQDRPDGALNAEAVLKTLQGRRSAKR